MQLFLTSKNWLLETLLEEFKLHDKKIYVFKQCGIPKTKCAGCNRCSCGTKTEGTNSIIFFTEYSITELSVELFMAKDALVILVFH